MHSKRPILTLMLATLLLSGCAAGRTAFSKAEQLEREGNLDAALVKYAEVANAHPEVGEYRVKFLNATDAAARGHFKKGETFFALKSYDDALREYQSAYALDPTQVQAKLQADLVLKMKRVQGYLQEAADFEKNRKPHEALTAYRHALELEPGDKQAKEAVDRLVAIKHQKLDGYELNLKSTKPITLKFKDAKLKEIFGILSQLSGINFVFDEMVKDVNVSLFLENATFQQAMEIITGMHKLDRKVLNESTIIVYPKTPDKIKQYEELFVQTFYLNKLEAKKAVNLIRTMLQVKKIYVNDELNALVIRDTPEVIEVARKILEANDVPDAEVLLEVEVFELSKNNAENFGLFLSRYAVSAAVVPPGSNTFFADTLNSVTNTSSTSSTSGTTTTATSPSNLLNLFAYKGYNGYLTVPNATFNFGKTLTSGETLANPKMRVKNREKAKFNVGTRVPITTTSSPSGGGVSVNVQYVDVGVKLNAEPTIQLNNEVSIKLGLEVSSILSQSTVGSDKATTVVTIGTRNLDTVLSLKDGETSIIGGLIQKSKNEAKDKIWLLGDIPFLGALFSNNTDKSDKSELLLAITPRIVRAVTVPEGDVAAFWSGREEEPSTNKPYSSFVEETEAGLAPAAPAAGAPAAGGAAGRATSAAARRREAAAAAAQAQPVPATPAGQNLPVPGAPTPATAAPTPSGPAARPAPMMPETGAEIPPPPAPALAQVPPPPVPAAAAPVAAVPQGGGVATTAAPVTAAQPAPAPAAGSAPQAPAQTTAAKTTAAQPAGPQTTAAAPTTAARTTAAQTTAAKNTVAPAPTGRPAAPQAQAATPAQKSQQRKPGTAPSKISLTLGVPSSAKVNDQFTAQVNAGGAQDLLSTVFVLTYDPKLLEVVSQSDGPLLKQGDSPISFQAFADKKKGELWVSAARLNSAQGASGDGAILNVTFKALAKGAAGIGFSNTNFRTIQGDQIPVTAFKSVVEVK